MIPESYREDTPTFQEVLSYEIAREEAGYKRIDIWHPLFDTPILVHMSQEQANIIADVLRGDLTTSSLRHREYLAGWLKPQES